MEPGGVAEVADRADPVSEGDEGQRRWHAEAEPGREPAREPGPQDAQADGNLAAGGAPPELAQRGDGGGGRPGPPAPPLDDVGPEVTEMRHRPAKRGQPEPQEGEQHVEHRAVLTDPAVLASS